MSKVIFIMGVSGSGKSLVGQKLSEKLSIPFIEGDDHHSSANIEKMKLGLPLNDQDRQPWLKQLNKIAIEHSAAGCVIACSALKAAYRTSLAKTIENKIVWIYLKGSYDQILSRMKNREGHFMKADMLRSQFETLEELENALIVDISNSPEQIIENLNAHLK